MYFKNFRFFVFFEMGRSWIQELNDQDLNLGYEDLYFLSYFFYV